MIVVSSPAVSGLGLMRAEVPVDFCTSEISQIFQYVIRSHKVLHLLLHSRPSNTFTQPLHCLLYAEMPCQRSFMGLTNKLHAYFSIIRDLHILSL